MIVQNDGETVELGQGPLPKAGQAVQIRIRLQRPQVNPEQCIGCGICQHECPVLYQKAIYVTAENQSRNKDGLVLAVTGRSFILSRAKEPFMETKKNHVNRRSFFKQMGAAAGAGALIAAPDMSHAAEKKPMVPRRPFGRTGVDVSILSLGGMFDIPNNQLLMRQALKWGINYWDTANSYEGGDSEKGIGKFFAKYPAERKNIFLVTKSGAWTLDGMKKASGFVP